MAPNTSHTRPPYVVGYDSPGPTLLVVQGKEADVTHENASPEGALVPSRPQRWGAGAVPSYEAIAEQYSAQYLDELGESRCDCPGDT